MKNKIWANWEKKDGEGANNEVHALVFPLTVPNYALFVCRERSSQRWRREHQATTLSLRLLAVKSRLLSLLQRELRQIFVKSGRYYGNGQESGEGDCVSLYCPKPVSNLTGCWGSRGTTFTSMHNNPTIKTLLCKPMKGFSDTKDLSENWLMLMYFFSK